MCRKSLPTLNGGAQKKLRPKSQLKKMFPAITYFRTGMHYHRPCKLNGRVRNGNVCFLAGKVTGIRRSASRAAFFCVKKSKCSKERFCTTNRHLIEVREVVLQEQPSTGSQSKWSSIPPLVLVSSNACTPYTASLSTW